jgi:hypothetical protein
MLRIAHGALHEASGTLAFEIISRTKPTLEGMAMFTFQIKNNHAYSLFKQNYNAD